MAEKRASKLAGPVGITGHLDCGYLRRAAVLLGSGAGPVESESRRVRHQTHTTFVSQHFQKINRRIIYSVTTNTSTLSSAQFLPRPPLAHYHRESAVTLSSTTFFLTSPAMFMRAPSGDPIASRLASHIIENSRWRKKQEQKFRIIYQHEDHQIVVLYHAASAVAVVGLCSDANAALLFFYYFLRSRIRIWSLIPYDAEEPLTAGWRSAPVAP